MAHIHIVHGLRDVRILGMSLGYMPSRNSDPESTEGKQT